MKRDPYRDVYSYAFEHCGYLPQKYHHVPLNIHDWEDFRQETLICIWQKRHLIDLKQSWKKYVRVLISNRLKNHIRNLTSKKSSQPVNRPNRIYTKVVQDEIFGEKTIVEPDLVGPINPFSEEDKQEIKRLVLTLPVQTQHLLHAAQNFPDLSKTARSINMNVQTAHSLYRRAVRSLRQKV